VFSRQTDRWPYNRKRWLNHITGHRLISNIWKPRALHPQWLYIRWFTKVMIPSFIRNTRKQGSWFLWNTVPNFSTVEIYLIRYFTYVHSRGNNSWYPVYKTRWYPADIRLISGFWIRSQHVCFQQFFTLFILWPLPTNIWLIFRHIQLIFFNFPPKSIRYLIEIWPIFSWYPFIIPLISGWYPWYNLISGVQISSKIVPLVYIVATLATLSTFNAVNFSTN